MATGKKLIQEYLTDVPNAPGIYQFRDAEYNILYIGKAKNIRKRLAQYTLELSNKNELMVSLAHFITFNVTDSEAEALILEAQLIKKFKPKFNIALKNDYNFPYIKLRIDHPYPQLLKFRGKDLTDGKFFGPFTSSLYVDITLREIQNIFKLRSCSDAFFASRTTPCIQYQIKKCTAPCTNKISHEDYLELVNEVKAFLSGKNTDLQDQLAQRMHKLSASMQFEKAAELRDKIRAISYIQLRSTKSHGVTDADVIAITAQNDNYCAELFLYRHGTPCGNQAYFLDNVTQNSSSEVLGNFLMQLYQNKIPPKQLILSHDLEDNKLYTEAIRSLHNTKTTIIVPKVGPKFELIQNALKNATISLQNHLKKTAQNSASLELIQELFHLKNIPNRIEVYDNSHIQGSFAVGAMIVAGVTGFEKKEYRLFNIKDKSVIPGFGGNDYAMLTEVLRRRLKRLKTEPYRAPDLMIIDGGKGHLSTTLHVMQEMGVDVPFVCMSKGVDRNSGKEQFHIAGRESFTLDKNQPVMKYLQILRDEAHNFAIKNHRLKRSKAITASSLDSIPTIGAARKQALLNYFGSFAAIADATIKELQNVEGISKKLAQIIKEHLSN